VLEVRLHLVLVAGIGVDDVPLLRVVGQVAGARCFARQPCRLGRLVGDLIFGLALAHVGRGLLLGRLVGSDLFICVHGERSTRGGRGLLLGGLLRIGLLIRVDRERRSSGGHLIGCGGRLRDGGGGIGLELGCPELLSQLIGRAFGHGRRVSSSVLKTRSSTKM
jgi:hypothetical protein